MKILEYSIQLTMLKRLLNKSLITKEEYKKVEQKLIEDYGIASTKLLD